MRVNASNGGEGGGRDHREENNSSTHDRRGLRRDARTQTKKRREGTGRNEPFCGGDDEKSLGLTSFALVTFVYRLLSHPTLSYIPCLCCIIHSCYVYTSGYTGAALVRFTFDSLNTPFRSISSAYFICTGNIRAR